MTSDMLSDSAHNDSAEERRLAMEVETLQFQLAIAEELGQDASTLNCIQRDINTAQLAFEQYQARFATEPSHTACAVQQSSWKTGIMRLLAPWSWFNDKTLTKPVVVSAPAPLPVRMTAGKMRRVSTQ